MKIPKLFLAIAMLAGCSTTTTERLNLPELEVVSDLNLNQYMGTWYEIASYPQSFQEGCTGTTASYTLQDDGRIKVLNSCRKGSLDGKVDTASGLARLPDPSEPAKLEVSFFRPFWGEYWVIDLGPDYSHSVVGHPSRDYLWILSRTPQMEAPTYDDIIERVIELGYDPKRLETTVQPN